jgi:F-type H+-transporting ATPase subunit b
MNINATLIGQTIAFFFFALFCWKFVWPPIIAMMEERKQKIAEGLAASDKAERDLQEAKEVIAQQLHEAKLEVAGILEQANKRASQIVEDAKGQASAEGERLKVSAKAEITQEANRAKEKLREQVCEFAVKGAEKILGKEIDQEQHNALVEDLIKTL